MIAVYFPDGRDKPGTLHLTRPDDQRPTPPEGMHRAKCGQILWATGSELMPNGGSATISRVCTRCFPDGIGTSMRMRGKHVQLWA